MRSVTPLDPGCRCRRRAGDCPVLPAYSTREGQGLVQGLLVARTLGRTQGPEFLQTHGDVCPGGDVTHTRTHPLSDNTGGKEALPGAGGEGPSCPAALRPHLPLSILQGKPPAGRLTLFHLLLCDPSPSEQPPQVLEVVGEPWGFPFFSCSACAPWVVGRGLVWAENREGGIEEEWRGARCGFQLGRGLSSLPTSHFPLIPI